MSFRVPPLALGCLLALSCASPPPPGYGDDGEPPVPDDVDSSALDWQEANLTSFISYPDEGSEECLEFSGCDYKGEFAAFSEPKSEAWVMENNIAAVHSKDFDQYKFKTLRLRTEDGTEIDVVVYDMCSDTDCDGCCTRNASETGFLIDLESYTAERFGTAWGVVEWACVNC